MPNLTLHLRGASVVDLLILGAELGSQNLNKIKNSAY